MYSVDESDDPQGELDVDANVDSYSLSYGSPLNQSEMLLSTALSSFSTSSTSIHNLPDTSRQSPSLSPSPSSLSRSSSCTHANIDVPLESSSSSSLFVSAFPLISTHSFPSSSSSSSSSSGLPPPHNSASTTSLVDQYAAFFNNHFDEEDEDFTGKYEIENSNRGYGQEQEINDFDDDLQFTEFRE